MEKYHPEKNADLVYTNSEEYNARPNSSDQIFLESVRRIVNLEQDPVEIADIIVTVALPKSSNSSMDVHILSEYIHRFRFGWDNYDDSDGEEKFATETIAKIKQILSDIKSGNQYTKIFSAELAYSRLSGSDYAYKIVTKKMSAKTINKARKEKDEICAKAPKQHPTDKDFALEDVRVMVKVVDQKGDTILKEDFLLN